ncbi:hypothetical protein H0H92_003712 [Tricholoma furcatifolium]|nr:hypothetical protein H0H92_003712 [Tricholoma furcatifolium]
MAQTVANSVPYPTVIEVDPFVASITAGNADDVKNVNLDGVHNLSGPIGVQGAEPGDCLVIDILDINYFDKMPWGYTGIFELENGGGLFAKEFNSKAAKAIWDLQGVYASSRHIPGVRFAGVTHPGIIGTAPSAELLAKWNERETGLIAQHKDAVPPVALAPEPRGVYVGQNLSEELRDKIAREGARTIPGREHGGNCDGEMSFCGAIEMAGIVTLSTSIIKGGVEKFGLKNPIFLPSPIDPQYSQQVVFEGIGVDVHGDGKQYNMDATVAYKQAALNAITYLGKDIMPKPEGLTKRDFGQCAIRSDGVV